MPYKFLEGFTTADVAFEARGKNLNELFESAALALFSIMAAPKKVKCATSKKFSIEKKTLEELMYSFLEEIIFLKDSEALVFNSCKVNISQDIQDTQDSKSSFKLNSILYGDKIDYKKQELRVDAKAITMHRFEVKKEKNGYVARVVVDI
ncbi:archease [Candidatus Woesearchaeota archaeon]|nr:archease [Candidatus Woesearchaeota archaeon]